MGPPGARVVVAHSDATGIVKQRMALMKGIGDAMKTLAAMFKGEAEYNPAAVRDAARTIHTRAGEHMTELFPQGSLHKPTEALPAIWEDWPTFERYAADLKRYSAALQAAAGNDVGPMHGGEPRRGGSTMDDQHRGMGDPMIDPEVLEGMPPKASFVRLLHTCSACHTQFRAKK
jgi:cytochrome c556